MDAERKIARRIRDWFEAARTNRPMAASQQIADDIDTMIAFMDAPLPAAAQAWKDWTDFQNSTQTHNWGLYKAMTLCRYAEWCADVALGLTDKPFPGGPQRITITRA